MSQVQSEAPKEVMESLHPPKKNDNLQKDDLANQKEVAYYSALVTAFITSRQEKDKNLITLSVAAMGFLMTVMSSSSFKLEKVNVLVAMICFFTCCVSVLINFDVSSGYVMGILSKNEVNKKVNDILSKILDKISAVSFVAGLLFLMVSFLKMLM